MTKEKDDTKPFRFKQFAIYQDRCSMKVTTDSVLLGAWVNIEGAKRILDIGAGSDIVAIMLGQRTSGASIDAVEIEETACVQARENMLATPWASCMNVINSAIQDFAKQKPTKYDLIVSNPPFFTGGTFSSNQQKASVRHTIKLPHSDLLSAARSLLAPEGRFCVILPLIEGLRFVEIAASYHLHCTRQVEVLPKLGKTVERLLLQFEYTSKKLSTEQLVVLDNNSEYSSDFVAITKDFYLNM